jgi:DNA polymerase III delta subunit
MITLLTGTDHFLLIHQKRALERDFLASNPDGELSLFDFSLDARPSEVRRVFEISEVDLFALPKMIFLSQVSSVEEKMRESLLEALVEKQDISWVILEPAHLKKTDVYTKQVYALKDIRVMHCDVPSEIERERILTRLIQESAGIDFDSQAKRLFLSRVGNDTAKLYSEFEKLSLYKKEGKITVEDVDTMLEPTLEDTGFQALDALAEGDKNKATVLFRNLFLWKKDALPIFGLCAWQIRQLLLLRESYDQGIKQSRELAFATGISPYVVGKFLRILPNFPLPRLKSAHAAILNYDHDIKQGLVDQGAAIDLFVWNI